MRIVLKGMNIKVILRATAVLMCVAAGALADTHVPSSHGRDTVAALRHK